jgi:hypothetical protein
VSFKEELGVDMGGVSRDFFEGVLSKFIADPSTGLFATAPDGGLLPKVGAAVEVAAASAPADTNKSSTKNAYGNKKNKKHAGFSDSSDSHGVRLFALGRLMALAVTAGIPLSVRMSQCFYKVLLGEPITANDVERIDPSFYQHRIETLMKPGGVAEIEEVRWVAYRALDSCSD